jgi:hypothetical protein
MLIKIGNFETPRYDPDSDIDSIARRCYLRVLFAQSREPPAGSQRLAPVCRWLVQLSHIKTGQKGGPSFLGGNQLNKKIRLLCASMNQGRVAADFSTRDASVKYVPVTLGDQNLCLDEVKANSRFQSLVKHAFLVAASDGVLDKKGRRHQDLIVVDNDPGVTLEPERCNVTGFDGAHQAVQARIIHAPTGPLSLEAAPAAASTRGAPVSRPAAEPQASWTTSGVNKTILRRIRAQGPIVTLGNKTSAAASGSASARPASQQGLVEFQPPGSGRFPTLSSRAAVAATSGLAEAAAGAAPPGLAEAAAGVATSLTGPRRAEAAALPEAATYGLADAAAGAATSVARVIEAPSSPRVFTPASESELPSESESYSINSISPAVTRRAPRRDHPPAPGPPGLKAPAAASAEAAAAAASTRGLPLQHVDDVVRGDSALPDFEDYVDLKVEAHVDVKLQTGADVLGALDRQAEAMADQEDDEAALLRAVGSDAQVPPRTSSGSGRTRARSEDAKEPQESAEEGQGAGQVRKKHRTERRSIKEPEPALADASTLGGASPFRRVAMKSRIVVEKEHGSEKYLLVHAATDTVDVIERVLEARGRAMADEAWEKFGGAPKDARLALIANRRAYMVRDREGVGYLVFCAGLQKRSQYYAFEDWANTREGDYHLRKQDSKGWWEPISRRSANKRFAIPRGMARQKWKVYCDHTFGGLEWFNVLSQMGGCPAEFVEAWNAVNNQRCLVAHPLY